MLNGSIQFILTSNSEILDLLFTFGKYALDALVIWISLFIVLKVFLTHERSRDLSRGVIIVSLIILLNHFLKLPILTDLINIVKPWIVIVAFIIFQPEIRSFLSRLGKITSSNTRLAHLDKKTASIDELFKAIRFLANKKIGALITVQRNDKLEEYLSRETKLDSQISFELLTTIFVHNSPLHDGAVIISNSRVHYAGAMLPTTKREDIDKELGSRHRAALGISEVTDAVTFIVSEQTGFVSIAQKGKLRTNLSQDEVKLELLKNI